MITNTIVIQTMFGLINNNDTESGGILGAKGEVIDHVAFDVGTTSARCSYEPDVDHLNRVIREWQKDGIRFVGLYHTHFFGVETLSPGDIGYIKAILNAMPKQMAELFFPVVLPEYQRIVPYRAKRVDGNILIYKDNLEIIEETL